MPSDVSGKKKKDWTLNKITQAFQLLNPSPWRGQGFEGLSLQQWFSHDISSPKFRIIWGLINWEKTKYSEKYKNLFMNKLSEPESISGSGIF